MVFCCLFSGEPLEDDPRKNHVQTFQVNMLKAPCADPGCFCASCLCPCCAQMVIRKKGKNTKHMEMKMLDNIKSKWK